MKKKILLIYSVLYVVANILMLLNQGAFWDDWTVYGSTQARIAHMFYQTGGSGIVPMWTFHFLFLDVPFSPMLYHCFSFFAFYFMGLIVWQILSKLNVLDSYEQLVIVFLFTFIPYYSAKMTMSCTTYSLWLFLFFIAFWCLLKFVMSSSKDKYIFRILSLFLFFISFATNSLLVFYIIPFTVILLIDGKYSIKSLLYADFLILPIAFWIFKSIYSKPSGSYVGYNAVNRNILSDFPSLFNTAIHNNIYYFFAQIIEIFISSSSFILFIALVIFITLGLYYTFKQDTNQLVSHVYIKKLLLLLFIGVTIFFIGAFPYVAVSKIPNFIDFESRHQLLLSLGAALSLASIILLFRTYKIISHFMVASICSYFIIINLLFQIDYLKLHFKQEALMKKFKNEKLLKENHTFLVDDKSKKYVETVTRHYTYIGMLHKVFGSTDKFMAEQWDFESLTKVYGIKNYMKDTGLAIKAENYTISQIQYTLTIYPSSFQLNNTNTVKMLYWNYFDKIKYQKILDNIISIQISPYK